LHFTFNFSMVFRALTFRSMELLRRNLIRFAETHGYEGHVRAPRVNARDEDATARLHRRAWQRGGVARTARQRVDERRSGGFLPAGSPIIGADDEFRGISVREQSSAWIAQDLPPSLSDL
jgi:hypothetical protein